MEVDIRGSSVEMPISISKVSSAAFLIWMELSVLVARQSAHVSYLSGFALNNEGREQAAMGIAVGGYNRDEKVDFCITNFSDDYRTLNRNDGGASFTDVSLLPVSPTPPLRFLAGAPAFSIMTTTDSSICSLPMGTSIPKSTSRTGAQPGRNARRCFGT